MFELVNYSCDGCLLRSLGAFPLTEDIFFSHRAHRLHGGFGYTFQSHKRRGRQLLSTRQEACEWEGRGQLWAEKQDKDVLKKLK